MHFGAPQKEVLAIDAKIEALSSEAHMCLTNYPMKK